MRTTRSCPRRLKLQTDAAIGAGSSGRNASAGLPRVRIFDQGSVGHFNTQAPQNTLEEANRADSRSTPSRRRRSAFKPPVQHRQRMVPWSSQARTQRAQEIQTALSNRKKGFERSTVAPWWPAVGTGRDEDPAIAPIVATAPAPDPTVALIDKVRGGFSQPSHTVALGGRPSPHAPASCRRPGSSPVLPPHRDTFGKSRREPGGRRYRVPEWRDSGLFAAT